MFGKAAMVNGQWSTLLMLLFLHLLPLGFCQFLHIDDFVLLIDDFMHGGSTAAGMAQVVHEFRAELLGIGVFIAMDEPEEKAVDDYHALLRLSVQDGKRIAVC